MTIFCVQDFKSQIELLKRKKSYRRIEQIIINYFFDKAIEDLKSNSRLNNDPVIPFIKKRLDGSAGYRVYYLLETKNEILYLMFIYPKTGTFGTSNLTDEGKTEIYKDVLKSIEENDLFSVRCSEDRLSLIFEKA